MSKAKPSKPAAGPKDKGVILNEAQAIAQAGAKPSAGLLYQRKYDLPAVDVSSRYLIFSSQRTGSNYLCRRLCNVNGHFGLPSEYLHPNSYRALVGRLLKPVTPEGGKPSVGMGRYLKALEGVRTTADGRFGIKVQPNQLLALAGDNKQMVGRFIGRFDQIIMMNRRDKLAQAISGALAQRTGTWFNDGKEPEIAEEHYPALMLLIASNLSRYIREERLMERIATAVKKPILQIEYEEVEADGEAVFQKALKFLAPGHKGGFEESGEMPLPERPKGAVAEALRERFLDFIAGRAR